MSNHQDENTAAAIIGGLIAIAILAAIAFFYYSQGQECAEAGGTYKAFENRCVINPYEVEVPV